MTFPPRNFELLARLGLEALGHSDAADLDRLTKTGADWGRTAILDRKEKTAPPSPPTLEDALHTLEQELRLLGDGTVVSSLNGDGFLLTSTNCIFAPLSEAYDPRVCALHQGAIAGMAAELAGVEFAVDHRTRIARGADICTTSLIPFSPA
jgi:predicted ArsR family transcriptional regulator